MSAEPTVNDELRQSFAKGLEALSDKQVTFLAVMLATLTKAIRTTTETALAEIRDELAELRRATGGSR